MKLDGIFNSNQLEMYRAVADKEFNDSGHIEHFLEARSNRYTTKSMAFVKHNINKFQEVTGKSKFGEVTADDVLSFLEKLENSGRFKTPGGLYDSVRAIEKYFNWAEDNGLAKGSAFRDPVVASKIAELNDAATEYRRARYSRCRKYTLKTVARILDAISEQDEEALGRLINGIDG